MRRFPSSGIALITSAFFSSIAFANTSPQPAQAAAPEEQEQLQHIVPFDGIWSGRIFFEKDAFLLESSTPTAGAEFRIAIHDSVVQVYTNEKDGLEEAMPGSFHIAPVMSNAVIYGTHSGDIWVETWTFTVTQKDSDTLLVEYSRIVNNLGLKQGENEKFETRGYGIFKRVGY